MTTLDYTRKFADQRSSVVDNVYYNDENRQLTVDLNGSLYKYLEVPASHYEAFKRADSRGSYYGSSIKNRFTSQWIGYDYSVTKNEKTPVGAGVGAAQSGRVGNVWSGSSATSPRAAAPSPYHSLKSVSSPAKSEKFDVTFEVNGRTKTHSLRAADVDAAVAQVLEVAKMLDLTFKVKSVTHYFD